ncbi:MAG: tetratricopeptide repeat protein, partial [Pseudomonadales bacterium]|nr:tetratricopeptide repeat protein [Pseudomonadales bacterium]
MTDQPQIYVNDQLFLGRVDEQDTFRRMLMGVISPPPGEELPYVTLLYGGGGMGKTTLARRFRSIAETEPPCEGLCQILWIDWEAERGKHAALQVGRENISAETVLERLHANAVMTKPGWGRHFKRYQQMCQKRDEAEQAAAKVLTNSGEQDELTRALVGATTGGLAKAIRLVVPVMGDGGEKLAQAFLEAGVTVGAAQAAVLRASIETRLRARLDTEQYQLFLNPHEQLARALAQGLRQVAQRKPLLIFFDTYEIIDRVDPWVREMLKVAGPHLLCVIAGRHDLVRSRQFGTEYFRGYVEDFPRRLVHLDMLQLAQADMQAYFADAAPQRPLTEEDAVVLGQATRGIPLAIKTAAGLWQQNVPLAEIVGDITAATPHQEIVGNMTARYMLHVVQGSADEEGLYALALARGNLVMLRAMLAPEGGAGSFDLTGRLGQLRRAYAAVHMSDARLHDEPTAFLTAYLREGGRRRDPRVQQMNERAAAALREKLARLESELPLLEERAQDEDWVQAALELARTLFWLDEQRAWQWIVPRFVEGLAYSRDLRRGLLQVAAAWREMLTSRGRQRLKKLQAAETSLGPDIETEAAMLDELEKLARPVVGWLGGAGEAERRAILDWQRGRLHYRQQKYDAAVRSYEQAEYGLPEGGELLKEQLGESLYALAGRFLWPDSGGDAVYHADAARLLPKVVQWLPERPGAWYRLGVVYTLAATHEEALAAYQQAVALAPQDAVPHNGLGNVYYDLGRYEEALAAYQQAVALDPQYAAPHNGLGNVYAELGRYEEALTVYQQAVALDPKVALPHNGLGNVYAELGRDEEALAAFQQAVALDPKLAAPHNGLGNVYAE